MVLPFTVVADDQIGESDVICQGCLFDIDGLSVQIAMTPASPGPAPRRQALRKAKKTSKRQENDLAEELGGYCQPGSGNLPGAKGDVRVKGKLRIEAKFTKAESFSLKLDELYKIAQECHGLEKPVFVIDFLDNNTDRLRERFAVIPFNDLKDLLHGSG